MADFDPTLPSAQVDEENQTPDLSAATGERNFMQSLVGDSGAAQEPARVPSGGINPMLALLPLLAQPQATPFQQGASAFLNGLAMARGQAPTAPATPGIDPYKAFQMFHTILKDQYQQQQDAKKMEMLQASQQRLQDQAVSAQQERNRKALKESSDFRIKLGQHYGASDDPIVSRWGWDQFIQGVKDRGVTDAEIPPDLMTALATKQATMEDMDKAMVDIARGWDPQLVAEKRHLTPAQLAQAMNPENLLAQKTVLDLKKEKAAVDEATAKAINAKYPGMGGDFGKYVSIRAARAGIPFPDMSESDRNATLAQAALDQQEDGLNRFTTEESIRHANHMALTKYASDINYQKQLGLAKAEQKGIFAPIGASGKVWVDRETGNPATGVQLDLMGDDALKQGLIPLSPDEVKRTIGLRRAWTQLQQVADTAKQMDQAGLFNVGGVKGAAQEARNWWQYYRGGTEPVQTPTGAMRESDRTLLRNFDQQKSDLISISRALDEIGVRAFKAMEPSFNAMSPSAGYATIQRVFGQAESALRSQAAISRTPGMFEAMPRAFPDPSKGIGTEGSKYFGSQGGTGLKPTATPDQYVKLRALGRSDQWIRDNYQVIGQ